MTPAVLFARACAQRRARENAGAGRCENSAKNRKSVKTAGRFRELERKRGTGVYRDLYRRRLERKEKSFHGCAEAAALSR